ncbi:S-ribosylhomocysteine lyase [Oscillospiraceae bacterium PP1C4]
MEKIASFCVDHTKLKKGIYLSRVDGDVNTYDLRMCTPNAGTYLENGALHTFEHLFATYVRNSQYTDSIVYVGPMGCRTGFYFLTRDSMSHAQVIALLREVCAFAASFNGDIPGNSEVECGNFRDHDLAGACAIGAAFGEVIKDWTPEKMTYEA